MKSMINKLLGLKSIRYIISGGLATAVDVGTYFICMHYVFSKDALYLSFITAPSASLMVSYSCGFVTNFSISKFFVFKESDIRTRHQLLRYFVVAFVVFVLNYFFMTLLLRGFHLYPTVARIIAVAIVASISFLLHKKFTFKVKGSRDEDEPEEYPI